ncbi:DUF3427 domain-containing protein [Loigolactobacillus jiayinensis]|uniref:DUF3427 domain-containing protein n=1 Tax=Loigolactobacillus jiayinensis TaxID=2486016 RepID=A0ABW1RGB3_9LACO|nr:DEAD/DEAH box helicase [Loigolactobacillus jiayinensis]
MDILERSLKKAFIDHHIAGSHYDQKLIINQPSNKEFLLNTLQTEISTCSDFFFSVAFITQSGLDTIKTQLADLAQRNISGKLLTSTYLTFNNPEVFKSLLAIPNLEVRISQRNGFHAKGYLFTQANYYSFVIGSSNLTMNALKLNYEWNVRLTSYENGELIQEISDHLVGEWHNALPLTPAWIANYAQNYQPVIQRKQLVPAVAEDKRPYIVPNKMQQVALKNLAELRASGEQKGLVISATGTGKTYLAAFDVQQAKPKRMLFIVHREQILNKAKASFMQIMADEPAENFGILSGNQKDTEAKYLFATIQTIAKPAYQELFAKDCFDYILIDEVHKAGAQSYLNVLAYFTPKFLLGMTATPERTDNFNTFELFDYNIAYEIRLQEALEEDLLCPFHYFGVSDYEKDGRVISETTDLQYLANKERVNFLLDKINYYGCSHNTPKGLIFCSRKDEAQALARLFNECGIPSTYLTGEHSVAEREAQIANLENGDINYIFTVDVFNEGIDVPKINQIIMLRNTQSSIIFVQQLGRGLRKDNSKDFVTVIDFIGNYKNNYMIPMALSGDTSRSKDRLRKGTFDTNYISGLSAINFEAVAKKRIFKSIDANKLDSMQGLKQDYSDLKKRLNRVPYLTDFSQQASLDPLVIANKFDSYYTFLVKIGDNEGTITEKQNKFLYFLSRELLPGMRQHEIVLLSKLIESDHTLSKQDLATLFTDGHLIHDTATIDSVLATLSLTFYTGGLKKAYAGAALVQQQADQVELTAAFQSALQNNYFKKLVVDLLEASHNKSKQFSKTEPLTRYEYQRRDAKYRRRDALRLLNWPEQMVDQNIGGYVAKDGKFVIFVTLEKGTDFKGAQMAYEDELIDNATMHWFTKSPRTLESKDVKKLQDPEHWTFYLFAKKSDDEGAEFYYLGEVKPQLQTIKQLEKPVRDGKTRNVVAMDLQLAVPLEMEFYEYLRKKIVNKTAESEKAPRVGYKF